MCVRAGKSGAVDMPTAVIDDIKTRYEVIGNGPPLLMYSPAGFDATLDKWTTQGVYARIKLLDHLPKKYTCIVFDRRETGQSGGRVERITWAHYVAQGKGLLEHLKFKRAHLMGGCMGCCPVVAFGVAYPEMVLSMTLYWPVGGAKYRINTHKRFADHLAYVEQRGLAGVVSLVMQEAKAFNAEPRGGPWASESTKSSSPTCAARSSTAILRRVRSPRTCCARRSRRSSSRDAMRRTRPRRRGISKNACRARNTGTFFPRNKQSKPLQRGCWSSSIEPAIGAGLQRPDLHLAPLDGATGGILGAVAELQGKRSLRVLAVPNVDGLDSVQHNSQLRALGGDLVGVPLAAGFRHGRDLGHIDDRSGAIFRLRTLVVDVHFIAGDRTDLGAIGAAQENAAVRRVIRPELRLDLKVLVGIIREEISALAFVGDDGTVLRSPVGVADGAEVTHAGGPVDERGPARVGPRHV